MLGTPCIIYAYIISPESNQDTGFTVSQVLHRRPHRARGILLGLICPGELTRIRVENYHTRSRVPAAVDETQALVGTGGAGMHRRVSVEFVQSSAGNSHIAPLRSRRVE